jgi:hypothetical protein
MEQQSLGPGFDKFTKTTCRVQFLAEMHRIVPWKELCAGVALHYPKPTAVGRRKTWR